MLHIFNQRIFFISKRLNKIVSVCAVWTHSMNAPKSSKRLGIHIVGEVSECDNVIIVFGEMCHIRFKLFWLCVNPRVFHIRHTVEGKDRDIPVGCLGECPREIVKVPMGTGSTCCRNQERMMQCRVVGGTAPPFPIVREFWSNAASGKMKAVFSKHLNSRLAVAITG